MNGIEKEIEEITEKAVRKDGDVTMCDLLDKEIEELTNQNEIEEMAKVICQQQYFNTHCVEHCNLKGYCCECNDLATNLYNAGYRNCKDKVVLSKEEFEFACVDTKKVREQEVKEARKETAREIVKALKNMAYQSNDWSHGEHPMVVEVDYIEEIAEEYGVEVEE